MRLDARNISYTIRDRQILNNVSLSVEPGELVVVIGANGAGKSSLLKVLTGSLTPTSGTVTIGDKNRNEWTEKALATSVGVMHQQTTVSLPFIVSDVVMMGRYPHFKNNPSEQDEAIVTEALMKAGVAHLAQRNYQQLSGGEQQRVHLARVFAQVWEPAAPYTSSLLFMDEPSNNLDVAHQHNMLQMATGFTSRGNTAIVVLHDLNLAMQYASKILLLCEGKALGFGTPAAVMTEQLMSHAYNFPVRVLNHSSYSFPIIMPETAGAFL